MFMNKILLIEKNPSLRKTLYNALTEEGYEVEPIKSPRDSIELLKNNNVSLIILSTETGAVSPYEAVSMLSDYVDEKRIILIVGVDDVKEITEVKDDIYDYLLRPVDISDLKRVVKDVLSGKENNPDEIMNETGFLNIIGSSPQMHEIYDDIKRVAPSKASILITGESGVGKELVADAIHHLSKRADGPYVKVHCAALAEGVLESEIFGHEKGAFTDAVRLHKGKFEQANGGTLFLDEVSEIPPYTQVKLLRVLEDGIFQRVGGVENIKVNIRLITATNRDLEYEVKMGRFREDLYWRIKVIEINIPPLRERIEDIPLLVENFIKVFGERDNIKIKGISDDALKILVKNPWYGNVRELRNAVEYMVVMSRGDILQTDDIPEYIRKPESISTAISIPIGTSIEEAEKVLVRQTLLEMAGDRKKTADALGITVRELHKLMNRYRLS